MSAPDRFILVDGDDEFHAGQTLVDTATGEELGRDWGEPEDRLFHRDLAWVPRKLNELAAEIERLRASEAALVEVLKEYVTQYGGLHDDDGCPDDDTCECEWVAKTNSAIANTQKDSGK